MQQVFSELKLININEMQTDEMQVDEIRSDEMQVDEVQADEMQLDGVQDEIQFGEVQANEMQTDENTIDLENKIIISELLLLYEDSVQKGIHYSCVQLIKQHIIIKGKNEDEIFNYLLCYKNKQQNIMKLLAI